MPCLFFLTGLYSVCLCAHEDLAMYTYKLVKANPTSFFPNTLYWTIVLHIQNCIMNELSKMCQKDKNPNNTHVDSFQNYRSYF